MTRPGRQGKGKGGMSAFIRNMDGRNPLGEFVWGFFKASIDF